MKQSIAHIALVVGWDRPLATFFAQVWDKRSGDIETQDDDGEWLLWVGCEWGEIRSLEELASLLSAYVELPEEIFVPRQETGQPGLIQHEEARVPVPHRRPVGARRREPGADLLEGEHADLAARIGGRHERGDAGQGEGAGAALRRGWDNPVAHVEARVDARRQREHH